MSTLTASPRSRPGSMFACTLLWLFFLLLGVQPVQANGFGKIFGHNIFTTCLAIANRVTHDFASDYHKEMDHLIDTVLERIF